MKKTLIALAAVAATSAFAQSTVTAYGQADAAYTSASTNIPGEWFNYLAHASFADFLRQDGQNEKAVLEENIAKGILDDQLQKTDVSRATGMIGHRISTHNSRSFRR